MAILIILACVPLYVINSFCDKAVSVKSSRYNYIYNSIKFFICSICTVPMILTEKSPEFEFGSMLCGVLCGVMYAVGKTVMLKGYAATSVAFVTLCHSSGMIVPCIMGHFLWSEKLTILSVIGIVITVLAIVLLKESGSKSKGTDIKGIVFGIIIFLTSAGVMITQKLMGIYFSSQSVGLYNLYSFMFPAVILCCLSKPSLIRESTGKSKKTVLLCALGSAVSLSVISFVMTKLASSVPSVILFPLFNGLGIIFVCIGSVFAFKESWSVKKTIGLILGVAGLCITNI